MSESTRVIDEWRDCVRMIANEGGPWIGFIFPVQV